MKVGGCIPIQRIAARTGGETGPKSLAPKCPSFDRGSTCRGQTTPMRRVGLKEEMVELSAGGVGDIRQEEDTEEKADGVDEQERPAAVGAGNVVHGGDIAHSLRREEKRSRKGGLVVGKIQPGNVYPADWGKESLSESKRVGEYRGAEANGEIQEVRRCWLARRRGR